jgi:hypothetical protein
MKRSERVRLGFATAVTVLGLSLAPAAAQQVTGELGSPSATTSIDGKQLPPPPPKFGGVIKGSATDSKPWWPPRIVPPTGAPNVLLIMTDDQGYGVSGTFGGVIPTPAMDRVAKAGFLDADRMTYWGKRRDANFWIENASVEWNEAQAPFHTIGRLTLLSKSQFQPEAGEAIYFDVTGNSTLDSTPVGSINRARAPAEVASRRARMRVDNKVLAFPSNDVLSKTLDSD